MTFLSHRAQSLFSCILIVLFVMLGYNRHVYNLLALCVVACTIFLYAQWKKNAKPTWPWVIYMPIPYFLYTAVSPSWWFKDSKIAMTMAGAYFIGLGAAFLPRKTLSWAFLILGLFFVGSLTFYYMAGQPEFMRYGHDRLRLFFFHPNPMSLVALFVAFYLACFYHTFSQRQKPFVFICLGICCLLPVLGVARSVIPGLLCCIPYLLVTVRAKVLGSILVLLLLMIAAATTLLPKTQQTRILSAITNPIQDPTFQSRIPLWVIASEGINTSPLIGNTHPGYRIFHQQYLATHGDAMKKAYPHIEPQGWHSHNNILHILFMGGAVGGLLLLLGFFPAVCFAVVQKDAFFWLTFLFGLGFGVFDVFIHRKDGIFFLFFPLGLVYGRHVLHMWQPKQQNNV